MIQSFYNFKNKTLNIAIIGAGRIAKIHLNNIIFNKRYKLVWIIDNNINQAKELADIAKCNYTDNLNTVLDMSKNNGLDCVLIASSTSTHYNYTIKCLKAGLHVFCEKPLGKNIEEIKECFTLAEKNHLKLIIGYQKRFDLNYIKLCKKVKDKKQEGNKLYNIRIVSKDNPLPPANFLKTSEGIVEDMISHDIDIINQLMNFEKPIKVIAFISTQSEYFKDINEIENIEILMQYKNGETVTFSGSRNATSYGYDKRVEVFGDFGMYQLSNKQDDTITLYNKCNITSSNINYSFPERFNQAYTDEINYLYDSIIDNKEILVKKDHIILTKLICNAINKSIDNKSIIYLHELENTENTENTKLRTYKLDTPQYKLYEEMHKNQTYNYVIKKLEDYENLFSQDSRCNIMGIKEVLYKMDEFIDPSDPDIDLPNSIHAYQTAERIRKKYPDDYALQVCGLIHDLGKNLFTFGEPNWSIVGDTYIVGCAFPKSIVYYDTMKNNPDFNRIEYSTSLGIYQKNCGLENVYITFGHDEYLYMILKNNKKNVKHTHFFPERYWNIIRFHSLYPWHQGGEYRDLMKESDYKILKDIKEFNKFDLYSKEDTDFCLTEEIKNYYSDLLDKFFPNKLRW